MKNKIRYNPDLLRYIKGEMTGAERNSFEKELERDPFLAEALEGYENAGHDEARLDLEVIERRVKRRAGRKRTFALYRIAASVAVLMIISSVFIVIERNKPQKQEAIPEYRSVTMDIARSEPIQQPEDLEKTTKTAPAPEKRSTPKPSPPGREEQQPNDMVQERRDALAEDAAGEKVMADAVQERKMPDSNRFLSEEKAGAQPAAAVKWGTRSIAASGYTPPQPAGGQKAFDKYILENIRRPDTVTAGQRAVVVTAFRVFRDGSRDSIRIIRSPGKKFSDEAIRLIQEGPEWMPATRDGAIVEDEVTVRIVFP